MTVTAKALIEAKYASTSAATEYTATGVRTIIDKFTATNTDAAAVTLTVYIVPSGQTAGATYTVISAKSIAAGATADLSELQNQILNSGDFISVFASTASKLVIRMSGREVT